jgi:hypothetical protein
MDIANQSRADRKAVGRVHLVASVVQSVDVIAHFGHIGDILGLPIELEYNDIFKS